MNSLETKTIVLIFFLGMAALGNISLSIYILVNSYNINSYIDDGNKNEISTTLNYIKYISIVYLVCYIITLLILFISLYYFK